MRKVLFLSAALAAFAFAPGFAVADTVVIVEPEVETWIMQVPGPVVTMDDDVEVGDIIPDGIATADVPDYDEYGYAIINGHRTLIDASTGEVIAIY
jgi:hypothetical protein